MPFTGQNENIHFFRHENISDQLSSVESAFKLFSSSLRDLNLKGVRATRKMFPDEYSEARINEKSLSPECRLFATRQAAEKELWKHRGSILEIGVASGSHAVSLISSTEAVLYCGVDINLSQLNESSKQSLENLSSSCNIQLIQKPSLLALNDLIQNHCIFDSIYIDASHWYYSVSRELDLCSKLVAPGGRIVLNDYLEWFVNSMEPCGVKRAVNEFLLSNPVWCVDYYAINDCDISLIKR
jgi:hypothetical protein